MVVRGAGAGHGDRGGGGGAAPHPVLPEGVRLDEERVTVGGLQPRPAPGQVRGGGGGGGRLGRGHEEGVGPA